MIQSKTITHSSPGTPALLYSLDLNQRRGAATIEAILILSVLTLLFAGGKYLGRLGLEELTTQGEARSCAWAAAASGCQEIPDGCQISFGSGADYHKEMEKLSEQGQKSGEGDSFLGRMFQSSIVDGIASIFAPRATSSAKSEVPRPSYFGGESILVGKVYSLPCNSTGKSIGDRFDDILGKAGASLIGAGDD